MGLAENNKVTGQGKLDAVLAAKVSGFERYEKADYNALKASDQYAINAAYDSLPIETENKKASESVPSDSLPPVPSDSEPSQPEQGVGPEPSEAQRPETKAERKAREKAEREAKG